MATAPVPGAVSDAGVDTAPTAADAAADAAPNYVVAAVSDADAAPADAHAALAAPRDDIASGTALTLLLLLSLLLCFSRCVWF